MRQVKSKVFVAMSGGVDSSVAAALLKKQGFDVVGVYMKSWMPNIVGVCPWKQDREDAMRVAAVLNIPFKTWDFSKEYKKLVADYMIKEYKAGRTPNPDIMCNKYIKFGLFLSRALKEGADFIATGHYVRKKAYQLTSLPAYKLLTAKDENKDQSYFLWTLTQKELKYCLFPIGDYTKPEVRRMARKFKLSTAEKKDSQGICFIGPIDMADFLKIYIKPKKGEIIDSSGNIVGQHDGIYYCTIGQRHGLDIKNGQGPYYATRKNLKKNIIYVGAEKDLYTNKAKIINSSWINPVWKFNFQTEGTLEVDMKIRYRSKSEKAVLYKNGDLKFIKPVRAITPGQSAVFYKGSELLGGGIII